MEKKHTQPTGTSQVATQQPAHVTASGSGAPPAAKARTERPNGGGTSASDAPPTNRASDNCNIPFFKPIRWGIDSLYLSYPGDLFPGVETELKHLKQLAQSAEPGQQSLAQYAMAGHIFEVKDKGANLFPYILEDGAFRIQLSRAGKKAPMAYVKVSATYLAHAGPVEAQKALYELLSQMGEIKGEANVSRIDLYVDFVSSVDMESWNRHAWVTRANDVDQYSVKGRFSGWAIGMGGNIACRLYDKVLEIASSGKNYLLGLWGEAGWEPSEPVWRLEFEIKREALTQRGLSSLPQVMANQGGLWSYLTTEWLRLTLPNPDDQTRSRWPVHPLWGYIASVDWEGSGGPPLEKFTPDRSPGNDKLFNLGLSVMLSYMAREGITDLYDGQEAFMAAMYEFHDAKAFRQEIPFDGYIQDKLALKVRQFNARLNNPETEATRQETEREKAARAYRKESDGD